MPQFLVYSILFFLCAFHSAFCLASHNSTRQQFLEVEVTGTCEAFKCQAEANTIGTKAFTNEKVKNYRNVQCTDKWKSKWVKGNKGCTETYIHECGYKFFCERDQDDTSAAQVQCTCEVSDLGLPAKGKKTAVEVTAGTKVTIPKAVVGKLKEYQALSDEYACYIDPSQNPVTLVGCEKGDPTTATADISKETSILWHSHPSHADRVFAPPSRNDVSECNTQKRKANLVTEREGTYLYYWSKAPAESTYEAYEDLWEFIGIDHCGKYGDLISRYPPLLTRDEFITYAATRGLFIKFWDNTNDEFVFYLPA